MNDTKVSVVPGDTLSEIAARYDVSVEELQRLNGIEDPDFLQAGQTIVVHTPMDASVPDLSAGAWNVWMMAVVVLAFLLFLFRRKRSVANPNPPASIAQPAAVPHQFESKWDVPMPARDIRPGPETNVGDGKPAHPTLDAAIQTFVTRQPRLTVNAGERLVGKLLKQRYRDWTHFNDLLLQSGQGTTQIDHILVSPAGVFVIETKDMNGWIFGSPGQHQWTQSFAAGRWSRRFGIKSKRYRFYNPLLQNEGHAKAIANLGIVESRWLRPIVVFVGNAEFKTADKFLPFDEHEKIAIQNPTWRMRGVVCMSLADLHRYIAFSAGTPSNPGLTQQRMETICTRVRAAALTMTADSHAKHVDYVQSVKEMASP